MNIKKISVLVGALISGVTLKADSNNENLWLMFAQGCDQYVIAQYQEVTVDSFSGIDEKGRNIYQIALDKHKETNSIPCVRMALFLEKEAKRLRNKLIEDNKVLDEVEKTFETPHQ